MTSDCCQKPNPKTLSRDDSPILNRLCLTCGTHWYGRAGDIQEYSRKEWDALTELPHAWESA